MAEVENVARLRSSRVEYQARFAFDRCGRCQQDLGIEVALQGDAGADRRAGAGHVGGPVEADGVATASGYALEPLAAALGEDDRRHLCPAFLVQTRDHALDVRERAPRIRICGKE